MMRKCDNENRMLGESVRRLSGGTQSSARRNAPIALLQDTVGLACGRDTGSVAATSEGSTALTLFAPVSNEVFFADKKWTLPRMFLVAKLL